MSALTINGTDVAIVQGGFRTQYAPQEHIERSRSGRLRRSRRSNPRVFSVTTAVMTRSSSTTLEDVLKAAGPFACTGDVLRSQVIYCYPVNLQVLEENIEDVRFTFELWEASGGGTRNLTVSVAGAATTASAGTT